MLLGLPLPGATADALWHSNRCWKAQAGARRGRPPLLCSDGPEQSKGIHSRYLILSRSLSSPNFKLGTLNLEFAKRVNADSCSLSPASW